MSTNNSGGDPNKSFRPWYELLKKDAPIAALGLPCVVIGIALLVTSGSITEELKGTLRFFGEAFLYLGFACFLVAVLVVLWRSIRH